MRFLENGPSIPSQLLEERDKGNVVFFCGAGISRRAGLPDFKGLTTRILDSLGSVDARDALYEKESFDRVFNALIREFGSFEVNNEIYEALKAPSPPDLRNHEAILKISSDSSGRPQIVTTNFDRLFELAHKELHSYIPPSLPELSLGQSIEGLVYLHGRLVKPEAQITPGYVLSSAEFGRAYLAEGWASRFVSKLRATYTIVLLGYSADDPPMRYLLEGLATSNNSRGLKQIFTFSPSNHTDANYEWRDRGVIPISYAPLDDDHSGLWDTLIAWGEAAAAPNSFNQGVLELAEKNPADLQAHQRGQVTQLISTEEGAKAFANLKPFPPSEWLCVFDPSVRYAKPKSNSFVEDSLPVDPLNLYGLDDDPPRPEPDSIGRINIPSIDYLSWIEGDTNYGARNALGFFDPLYSGQLPERLDHLCRWFEKVMDQPAAIWWASGKTQLHPRLLQLAERRLGSDLKELPSQAKRFWQLYLEASESKPPDPHDPHDLRWYGVNDHLEKDKWSTPALRRFERALTPYLKFARYPYGPPPVGDWNTLALTQVVNSEIVFLNRHRADLSIPKDKLPMVVSLMRKSLVRASQLLSESEEFYFSLPSLHPDGAGEENYYSAKEEYFLWFKELFVELLEFDPKAAKLEVLTWNINEYFFFTKLKLFAMYFPQVLSGHEVAHGILDIDDENLWERQSGRELLWALKSRWQEFTTDERLSMENRILTGQPQFEDEAREEYIERSATRSLSMLRWLELNGCELTKSSTEAMMHLKKQANSKWSDDWAEAADDSFAPKVGWVETVKDTQGLEDIAISEVVAFAELHTRSDHREDKDFRPFEGLVTNHPRKAVAALRHSSKQGHFPKFLWIELLSQWPENTSYRLRYVLLRMMAELPTSVLLELRFYVPRWLKDNAIAFAGTSFKPLMETLGVVQSALVSAGEKDTTSSISFSSSNGANRTISDVSHQKAINSPIGHLAEIYCRFLQKEELNEDHQVLMLHRLEALFKANGHGAGHAISIAASYLGGFFFSYDGWTKTTLIPMFETDRDSAEAAWNGVVYRNYEISLDAWECLAPMLLAVLKNRTSWVLGNHETVALVKTLVELTRSFDNKNPIVKFNEAREALVSLEDKHRGVAIHHLLFFISKEGKWHKFVKPFIENAWPKQLACQTENSSTQFLNLIEHSGDLYPEVVSAVSRYLRPIEYIDSHLYQLGRDNDSDENRRVNRFPKSVLTVLGLTIDNRAGYEPHGLKEVLIDILKADPELLDTFEWRRLSQICGVVFH